MVQSVWICVHQPDREELHDEVKFLVIHSLQDNNQILALPSVSHERTRELYSHMYSYVPCFCKASFFLERHVSVLEIIQSINTEDCFQNIIIKMISPASTLYVSLLVLK